MQCGPASQHAPSDVSAQSVVIPQLSEAAVTTVDVRLFATLRQYSPGVALGEAIPVNLKRGATVAQLAHQLGLPADQVKLVFVNGLARDQRHVLADGDEVGIFPPVGGG